MAAFSPKSAAALTAERELWDAAMTALTIEGFYAPHIEWVERAREGEIKVGFHIELVSGKRGARTATITTDKGTPAVRVVRGWPV